MPGVPPQLQPWIDHVRFVRAQYPNYAYKDALIIAKRTYKKAKPRDPLSLYSEIPKWYRPCAKYKKQDKCPPKYLEGLCTWSEAKQVCRAGRGKRQQAFELQKSMRVKRTARRPAALPFGMTGAVWSNTIGPRPASFTGEQIEEI